MRQDYTKIKLLSAREFLDLDLPEIEYLVGDWFPRCGSLLLGGAPKVGKSWFVYSLADAIAHGQQYLNWPCAQGAVVIIDCDNRPHTIQHRLALMARSNGDKASEHLRIITRETFTENGYPFPEFRDKRDMMAVFELIGKADVVFLDNVNLAFPGGNENETTFWNDMESFVLEARKRGMASVVVHHAVASHITGTGSIPRIGNR